MIRFQIDSFAPLACTCRLQATAVAHGAIRPSVATAMPRQMWITTG